MYDHVDLFSGLGCWAIAARANGLRTIAFCEREEWLATGLERTWGVPCHRDIKTFPASDYRGTWLLTGSPPCQPASCAGKRRGKADDRWLWDPTVSVCEAIQPTWFIFENPPGLDGVGLDGIISDLERVGYEVATLRIPACAVDSPQLRDRFWIVGNSKQNGRICDITERNSGTMGAATEVKEIPESETRRSSATYRSPTQSGAVADALGERPQGQRTDRQQEPQPHDGERIPVCGVTGCALADGGCGTHSGTVQPEGELTAGSETEPRIKGVTLANGDQQPGWTGAETSSWTQSVNDAWSDYEWIPFNGAVYRAPVGLYELAYESTVVIPKKFRSKLISALGNAIVWPVAAQIIKAIKANDPVHATP